MRPNEAFLSHCSLDHDFTIRVAATLRRHGVPLWFSQTNIMGAQQWHDEIGSALRRCDWFIVVLSPDSVGSRWVKHELIYALQQARFEDRIVPLLYRQCDIERLSWVLPAFQHIDFRSDFDDGCRDLLRLWGLGHQPAYG